MADVHCPRRTVVFPGCPKTSCDSSCPYPLGHSQVLLVASVPYPGKIDVPIGLSPLLYHQ